MAVIIETPTVTMQLNYHCVTVQFVEALESREARKERTDSGSIEEVSDYLHLTTLVCS